jgi:hypothetical protein
MTWQKWGSKQALEKRKTSLSLMEVFIEHVWDFIGRKINQRNPNVKILTN